MSYNNNRQNEQLPKVFSRLGRATPPRQPNHNSNHYYNGQQSNDGFRIARTPHLSNPPYHYNPNMVPNHMQFQPHLTSFYSGSLRPQQGQAHQQNPYFSNNNNNTTINTNGRMSTNFRPDASSSTPTPPPSLLPPVPSSSSGNKNGFSFVKNIHKDPAASDMIISFVRNDNTGTYTYRNKSDQNQDQAILHSPPSSTVSSPSVSTNSDHAVVDYHPSSRRTYDNDRDEQDHQAAPSHRDIIAKSIKITASRPLGSDENTVSSSSVSHHHGDNTIATTTIKNNDLDDKQQQNHHSDNHEMKRTIAVNRKVIVEKRDRSCDNTISSSKRSRLSSRSISPSPVRDKRTRSLSRESDDHYHRKHSRRVSNSEEDDGNNTRRKRRSPSPISPPNRNRYDSHRDGPSRSLSSDRRRTSISPFGGRTRSLSPGSSSDEDNAPFLRHEADRYIPDYNRRPLPPQHRRSRVSNDNNAVASPVRSSKSAGVVAKPSPTAKSAPAVAKSAPVVVKPAPAVAKSAPAVVKPAPAVVKPAPAVAQPAPVAPVAVKTTRVTKPTQVTTKPSTAVITSTASSKTTKPVPVVPTTSSSSSTENDPLPNTCNTSVTPKPSDTTGKQLRNFPPLGNTSMATKSAHTTKELRNFPPLGSSASKSTRSPPITVPAPRDLRSFPPLGHHPSRDLRSYPPLSSNVPSIATSPHAKSSCPHSPSASPVTSSSNRSYNRVWMKPTNDGGANGQQEGSNIVIHKQVLPPPLATVTQSPPPSSITNQLIKINRNNDSMMAQVKQEPISEVLVKKPVPAAPSVTSNAQVPHSGPAITSTALLNDQIPSSNATTSSPAPQNESIRALPPSSSSATIQKQNKVQTNGATTIPSPSANLPTTVVQSPSVINQKTDANVSTCASTEVTTQTQTEGLSKSARRRRAKKLRQLEQSRMLAIEERDDVVMDVLPASQQPPTEEQEQGQEQEQDNSISNANAVIISQTQLKSLVQNMDVYPAARSHENGAIIANNSPDTSAVTHQIVQSQLLSPPNSMDEHMSEQSQQQETFHNSVPASAVVPDAPTPTRSSRRKRLPSPWKVKMSDSMEIYYHNPITGEDTSIRPE